MSDTRTGFVLGYHGCSHEVAEAVLGGSPMKQSEKAYDWLGHGAYFWEGDPQRAWEWARAREAEGGIERAAVIGAVIDLGNCLDLTKRSDCEVLAEAYQSLAFTFRAAKEPLPENRDPKTVKPGDKLLRYLDCAVIQHLHENIEAVAEEARKAGIPPEVMPFDTVRGLFPEGGTLYTGGGFYSLTHTQIAVRNDRAVIGYFRPR